MNERKILLLDDNKDLVQVLQIILKGQGYDTITACSVEEAVSKIKIHRPYLILMDVFICDEDGRQLCQQLKYSHDTENIRIIMMSGNDSLIDQMADFGADDFMPKPFDYNDLLSRIANQMMQIPA